MFWGSEGARVRSHEGQDARQFFDGPEGQGHRHFVVGGSCVSEWVWRFLVIVGVPGFGGGTWTRSGQVSPSTRPRHASTPPLPPAHGGALADFWIGLDLSVFRGSGGFSGASLGRDAFRLP